MRETLTFGRIAGVRVGANWTLAIIFGLIAWSFAGRRLPLLHPGFDESLYWATGVLTALIFFAALVAHELGHAVVARHQGVQVEGITLWLFGGVAKLRGDTLTAAGELRIALAGPLVSLALAGAFATIGAGVAAAGASRLMVDMFSWLWRINLLLAAFNMIPAFPLDGGRVLRAILWRFRGKLAATRAAAWVGRGVGYSLAALGALAFGLQGRPDGLWIGVIGWFVAEAARSENAGVVLKDALDGFEVRDVMAPDPPVAPAWLTLDVLVGSWAHRQRVSVFPLAGFDGSAAGLLTLDGIKRVPHDRRAETRADAVAVPMSEVPTGAPDEPFNALLERMAGKPNARALVLEGGRVVGIVSPSDIDRALEVAALRAR